MSKRVKVSDYIIEIGFAWEEWVIGIQLPTIYSYFTINLLPLYILIYKESDKCY